jgi:2-polyprenyl-3-methyl-5-hydroxy-6-metoxy-1,4-benzoquinol methylase
MKKNPMTSRTNFNVLASYPRGFSLDSFFLRLFLWLRWHLTPYFKMAARLPREGEILDLGSGHGLLSVALAMQSPARKVLGIDHDEERVKIATEAASKMHNLRFERGSILAPPSGKYHGIALIDVMHYFPPEEQETILRQAAERLKSGGVLIVREVNPNGGWISQWNRLYEKLATATGFTRSDKQTVLHFRTPVEWSTLLSRIGLQVSMERCSSPLFADVLYVGKAGASHTPEVGGKPS